MDAIVPSQDKAPDGTGYNDPPVNFKEITEADFAKSQFHSYSPTHIEFRQMILKDDLSPGKLNGGKMVQAKLFWFGDDTGVAISADYWKGKVRYFSFGCNHSLVHGNYSPAKVNKFEAPHHYKCSKCNTEIKEPWMELIVEDSGWKMNEITSRPQRGIRDYDRSISFSRELDDKEQKAIRKFLSKVDCPGWTGVGMRWSHGNTYKFNTTYDSSD